MSDADTVRVKMTVAYDGGPFHGFAEQEGLITVAGTLRCAIERVVGHPIELVGAGRTDRGVHARAQVVSFDASRERFDPARLQRAVSALCRPAIAVRSVEVAGTDFNARFSAKSRVYRYTIQTGAARDPLIRTTSWYVPGPIQLDAVRNASIPLVGTHDFSAFCRRPKDGQPGPGSQVRHVRRIEWTEHPDDRLVCEIEANAFCWQMVRSIVGLLIDVGIGRRRASDVAAVVEGGRRVGTVAPPEGLVLWEVRY